MLIMSFSKSVRPEELHSPAWDVALVLQCLTRAPYEPLRSSDECFLAQKTLFLLSLASAKRVDELHALSYRVSHSRGWGEVSFTFIPGFVAKTQIPPPLLLGLRSSLYQPYQTRAQIAMGDCCVQCGRSGVTWTARPHIVCDVSGCLSPQYVARRRSPRTRSPSGSGRRYLGRTSFRGVPYRGLL